MTQHSSPESGVPYEDPEFVKPASPESDTELRLLVDIVWNHATESTAVPSTKTADALIAKYRQCFPALAQSTLEDMARLMPCPFCGGTDDEDNACQTAKVATRAFQSPIGKTAYQVECGCGARGPADVVWAKANAAWNNRAVLPSTVTRPDGGGWS